MQSNFDAALQRLLIHEGGYTNHPADPGGPTNYGITLADYRRYVKPGATADDVRRMTLAQAQTIYRAHYWDALRCDDLPGGVDYTVFDYGVNSGIGRSAKVLQRLVGVALDGELGPATFRAVRARDAAALIGAINDERLRFLKGLKTWPVFGKGWGTRVADVRAVSLVLARNAPTPNAPPAAVAPGKGVLPGAASHPAVLPSAAGAAVGTGAVFGWAWLIHHPAAIAAGVIAAVALVGVGRWTFERVRIRLQESPSADLATLAPAAAAARLDQMQEAP